MLLLRVKPPNLLNTYELHTTLVILPLSPDTGYRRGNVTVAILINRTPTLVLMSGNSLAAAVSTASPLVFPFGRNVAEELQLIVHVLRHCPITKQPPSPFLHTHTEREREEA